MKSLLKSDFIIPYMYGTGMVLFVVHNLDQPLIEYIALPNIGLIMVYVAVMGFIGEKLPRELTWRDISLTRAVKGLDIGSKYVYIPLLIIVCSIIISGIINGSSLSLMMFGFSLFFFYLFGRHYGGHIFIPFAWAVVVFSIGMVVTQIINPGVRTGGWISPTNYDIATGLLIFGSAVAVIKKQWVLMAVAVVALFLTGAEEALFAVCFMAIVVIIRRDLSYKTLLPVASLAIAIAVCTPIGITGDLWDPAAQKIGALKEALEDTPVGRAMDVVVPDFITDTLTRVASVHRENSSLDDVLNAATNLRWLEYWKLSPIKPFGYGYNVNDFYRGIPHNVVLIIIEQIGPLSALAWLWLVGYGILKTKWKYAWMSIVALSIWDHYIWTQAAIWMPSLLGASTIPIEGDDRIYDV